MSRARLVATLGGPPTEERLGWLAGRADILEVRSDLVGEVDTDWLRSRFPGELLWTLRSREEGGRSETSRERRHRRLLAAAPRYDLVDLECQRDLVPDLLDAIPPARRIVSWHGPPSSLVDLQGVFARMLEVEARHYKLVPAAEQHRQEMAPLALLHSLRRTDVIAFASGAIGGWTRLLAPRLGAPVVFGSADDQPAAPGQPSIATLIGDYRLPDLPAVEALFGVVGSKVAQSLSPRLHNRMYEKLGLPFLYLPFQVEEFGEFWLEVVEGGGLEELGFDLRGLSVTAPHKRIASAVAGASSPLVEWLGSANTLLFRDGVWEAESTDGDGCVGPLRDRGIRMKGRSAAVLGAGGAGRAACLALREAGASVTLVNRTPDEGRRTAAELRVAFRSWDGFDPAGFAIVVQATPLGGAPDDPLPLDPGRLDADAVVVDLVYRSAGPTRLVSESRLAGRAAVDGREVLLFQAVPQFRMMTGRELPVAEARAVLGLENAE